jgi:hypothetical protein
VRRIVPHGITHGVGNPARHVRKLARTLAQFPPPFPPNPLQDAPWGHWNLKLPVSYDLVDPRFNSAKTLRQCAQLMVDTAARMAAARPEGYAACVHASISAPDMFRSEICVFYCQGYFQDFFNRHSPCQTWRLADSSVTPLSRRLGFRVPEILQEFGVVETLHEPPEPPQVSEIWFYQEIVIPWNFAIKGTVQDFLQQKP